MKKILNIPGVKEKFITGFKLFETSLNGTKQLPVHNIRREAIAFFEQTGFPSMKNEEWKYTNVEPLLKEDFHFAKKGEIDAGFAEKIKSFFIDGLDCYRIIFVNGFYNPLLSTLPKTDSKVTVTNFAEALKKHYEWIEPYFARYANYKSDGFSAVNAAFAADGLFVHLSDKAVVDKPVHFLFISDKNQEKAFAQPRNLIIAGKHAQAVLIESHHAIGQQFSLTNSVSEIILDENAVVDHYIIQHLESEGASQSSLIHTTQTVLSHDSKYNAYTVSLSGSFVRNNLNILLQSTGCETHLYGLYLPKEKEFMDNHTLVDHIASNCFSNEYYKGVMSDQSRAVFNGKVMVRTDAQKTNAYQTNKNILLSDEASVYTKPQLEIFADDVKCSHGATTGQLDEEALFYLKTRGISDASARAMLTLAFAEDVISNIKPEPLRKQLETWIEKRLTK